MLPLLVHYLSLVTTLGNLSGTGSISGFDANLNDQQYQVIIIHSTDNGKVVTIDNSETDSNRFKSC